MQWSHEISELDREGPNYLHFHGAIEPQTTYELTITIGNSEDNALQRFLGFFLIGVMPDEGLEEALFSLRDMLEFYSKKPTQPLAKLTPKAIDVTITDKKKRPDLIIA